MQFSLQCTDKAEKARCQELQDGCSGCSATISFHDGIKPSSCQVRSYCEGD
jgi:hypothetical protein